MDRYELLAALEEGLENGRINPQTAAYIAAEILGVDAYETGYQEWDVGEEPVDTLELAPATATGYQGWEAGYETVDELELALATD